MTTTFKLGPRTLPCWSPAWSQALVEWTDHMLLQGLSRATIRNRVLQVRQLSRGLQVEVSDVGEEVLMHWLSLREWGAETRRVWYCTLRLFFDFACAHEFCVLDPATNLPTIHAPVMRPRAIPDPILLDSIREADQRTFLILTIAAETGARRGEIARIHFDDLSWLPTDGWWVVLHGKGGKDRTVPVPDRLADEMNDAFNHSTGNDGWLFPSRHSGTGHLSGDTIGKRASDALPHGWTLHSCRHRFGTVANNLTHDLASLQVLLGHASLATTRIYINPSDESLRLVVDKSQLDR